MRTIAIVTATRAEYGLLAPVIKELRKYENNELRVELIVTGTHLYDEYGMTVNEIADEGIRIDHKIKIPVRSESAADICHDQAETLENFAKLFSEKSYDGIMLLGDRYEMLAVAIACGNTRTPIFHLCGGDTTEGAIDEWIRHSITKMSFLHFVTNEASRRRVIQLGEDPARVFNYGSTSIDNILTAADMSKEEALLSIGLENCCYALCTYHPVTMEGGDVDRQVEDFLEAIRSVPDILFIVTKSNADQGGARINELLCNAEQQTGNLHVFSSLGVRRYLSLMKYSEFVLGNSSSGIIEAPAFHVPTINIGDRQRGRLMAESIINCGSSADEIISAMDETRSENMRKKCRRAVSYYGDGHAAEKIAKKTIETVTAGEIDLKKKFYEV